MNNYSDESNVHTHACTCNMHDTYFSVVGTGGEDISKLGMSPSYLPHCSIMPALKTQTIPIATTPPLVLKHETALDSPSKCCQVVLCVVDDLEYLHGAVRRTSGQLLAIVIHLSVMLEARV